MKTTKRTYDREFKLEALRLLETSGGSAAQIERDLGITPGHSRWCIGLLGRPAEVYPDTQEQRCWVHKIANVLDKLPKRLQPRAKEMLHEIMRSASRKDAVEETDRFSEEFDARYPKAVETLLKDQDQLLRFFDFPAQHWIHFRALRCDRVSFLNCQSKDPNDAGCRLPQGRPCPCIQTA